MTKTHSMVSHKNYNLNGNERCVIFLTPKLITCLMVNGCTLKLKCRWIAHLLSGSEHILYLILDLEGEVHSIWDLWISGLQKCKDNDFFEVRRDRHKFAVGSKKYWFLYGGCPCPHLPPQKACMERLNVCPEFLVLLPNCLYMSTGDSLQSPWSVVAARYNIN
jgi:hypothetical protein